MNCGKNLSYSQKENILKGWTQRLVWGDTLHKTMEKKECAKYTIFSKT